MRTYLSFEQPVADIDARIDEMRAVVANGDSPALVEEIAKLEAKSEKALADLYAALTPWQKTQVARVQGRPRCADYLKGLIAEFTPLAGDRYFGEDEAIVGGPGPVRGRLGGGHRPGEGQRHREPPQAQFRHGPSGGLPQGGAADGTRRPVRASGDRARRHRGRFSRRRRRGTRPGRGDRPVDRRLPRARRPQCGDGDRRGRLGRRHRHRHRQQGADARARDLHRRLARSRRLDPVAGFVQGAGGGDRA